MDLNHLLLDDKDEFGLDDRDEFFPEHYSMYFDSAQEANYHAAELKEAGWQNLSVTQRNMNVLDVWVVRAER